MRWMWAACGLVMLVGCNGESVRGDDPWNGGNASDAATPPHVPPSVDAGLERDAAIPIPRDAATNGHDAATVVRDASIAHDAAIIHDASVAADAATGGIGGLITSGAGAYKDVWVDNNAVSVYVPNFVDPTFAAPVVFSFHGLSIPAIAMADITGLPAVADKEGFIAVFPAGSGGTWNTGGAVCGLGAFAGNAADDATYVEHMLDAVHGLHPIDRARVFISGFSMGGYATNALACSHPDRFRAAAPAAGGFPSGLCGTQHLPVMIFHGTSDGTIAHQCGVDARTAWVAHNGCSAEVDEMPIMGGACEWSRGCPEDGQVVLCSFVGMGHGWAGSINPFAFGGGAQFESATSLMWSFFKQQL